MNFKIAGAGTALALAVMAGLGGCASDEGVTPMVEEDVRARIESLEILQGREYLNSIEVLGTVIGPPAVPLMLDALEDHRSARVRAGCAQALGRAQDSRAIPGLLVASRNDENSGVRLTAAYALCRFRDPRGLPVLIDALRSDDPSHRRDANLRLVELTDLDFGYQHLAAPAVREAAALKWERWYEEKGPEEAAASLLPVRR